MRDLEINTPVTDTDNQTVKPPVFNPDDYRDELNDLDLTDEQAHELLSILWNIMSTMVDIGWGLDATQLVLGQIFSEQNITDQRDEDGSSVTDNKKEPRP